MAVFPECAESCSFGNQNFSFHVFAVQEIGIIGNNSFCQLLS